VFEFRTDKNKVCLNLGRNQRCNLRDLVGQLQAAAATAVSAAPAIAVGTAAAAAVDAGMLC
jgi:hypothetical protein